MSDEHERDRWPVDPATGQPIEPRAQPGYYPGFSTLAQQAFWDDATRDVVLERVYEPPAIRFFTADELPLMHAVFDRLMPQDDRDVLHRVPIVNVIDARLHDGRSDGYRYEDMPPDPEAYRQGLAAIDAIAQHLHGRGFVSLAPLEQDAVLETVLEGRPPAGEAAWAKINVRRFWALIVQDAAAAYYAHPYAWDEIGFGGPAYPRGYMRLEGGAREPWEVNEKRYAWDAPPTTRSNVYREPDEGGEGGGSGTH